MTLLHRCRAVALSLGLSAASAAVAHEAPERPLITVTGQAEVRVAPDEAVLQLRAVTLDKDPSIAKSKNDDAVKAALALLGDRGIKPEQVQTGALEIDRKETHSDGQPPIFLGYETTRRLTIVIRDLKQADEVVTALLKTGVNRVDAFELRNSDLRKHKDEARAMAIRAAREKAIALTKEIGQTIGKAYTITEEALPSWPSFRGFNRTLNTASYSDTPAAVETAFSAGQNSITAIVTVSFELQ